MIFNDIVFIKEGIIWAASELKTERRIADIAMDYGFETHSGFSKAFRRYFKCSPENYREHASFDVPKLPILEKTRNYISNGIVMEPKMVKKEAIKIAGFKKNLNSNGGTHNNEIPKFWFDYLNDGSMERLHAELFLKDHTEYGVCSLLNSETGEIQYVIGVEIKEGHEIPEGYHVCSIPQALYAVFTSPPVIDTDSFEDFSFPNAIQGTWGYIYSEWFPQSGYESDSNGVDYELYDERSKNNNGKAMDICISVTKKYM